MLIKIKIYHLIQAQKQTDNSKRAKKLRNEIFK